MEVSNASVTGHVIEKMYERLYIAVGCAYYDKRAPALFADIYTVFLAEIQATSTRVFSLNLERQQFIKVQFLYDIQESDRESHLIVMLHRECE